MQKTITDIKMVASCEIIFVGGDQDDEEPESMVMRPTYDSQGNFTMEWPDRLTDKEKLQAVSETHDFVTLEFEPKLIEAKFFDEGCEPK